MINSYIAIDLETTGLEAKLEKITEIAALRVTDGVITDRLVTLINPKRKLGERITELTGITDEMVADAPPIGEVIRDLVDFCGDLPLLGHNIIFDYGFLKRAAVNNQLAFEKEGIDTLTLCRTFMPADIKRNLGCACAYYKILQSTAHRAEADAEAAHQLYQKMKGLHSGDKPELFTAKPLIYKAKREQPATKRQKDYLRDLAKCHRIDITVQIDAMSRSEVSRMIDNIISQYGRMTK
ncbi:MAG: 3'-5' exonuclease [Clostridium sp.]|nr:3'-5' exonuclease [Clostridium sp.]